MKTILSLVLPVNATWRYINKGRKAIGFKAGTLVTRSATGVEIGVGQLASGDTQTLSATPANLTKRLNYCTHAAATQVVFLPPVTGELRDVWVIKNGANAATVTINAADSGNIILSGAAASTTSSVATTTTARFLSNGTNWFRVG